MYAIFRQDPAPVRKMILIALVMQVPLLIPLISNFGVFGDEPLTDSLRSLCLIAFLISSGGSLAFPYVPGILVCRAFTDAVIPRCRHTCPGSEIVRGAMQSLRHMLGRYTLFMLPGILVFFVFIYSILVLICNSINNLLLIFDGKLDYPVVVWICLLSFPSWLLSKYALAVYPVARLFTRLSGSREPGMYVTLALVYVGMIGLALNPLITAGKLFLIVINAAIFAVCTGLFINAIADFTSTAKRCGEIWERKS